MRTFKARHYRLALPRIEGSVSKQINVNTFGKRRVASLYLFPKFGEFPFDAGSIVHPALLWQYEP
jgi:hypothetical protein